MHVYNFHSDKSKLVIKSQAQPEELKRKGETAKLESLVV